MDPVEQRKVEVLGVVVSESSDWSPLGETTQKPPFCQKPSFFKFRLLETLCIVIISQSNPAESLMAGVTS